jgi:hypothetical protein
MIWCRWVCFVFVLLIHLPVHSIAQKKTDTLILDSIKIAPRNKLISGLVKKAVKSIKKKTVSKLQGKAPNTDSINRQYNGRTIRHITIRRYGFEKKLTDTTTIKAIGTVLMNTLHVNTKEWVIRNHLFIKEGRPFDHYRIADNERYLRTLSFVNDARITIQPVGNDSVDLVVTTKDLFSLTGGADFANLRHVKANAAEANLFGMGQRLQVDVLLDQQRDPKLAYSVLYRKYCVFGSFVNLSLGYTLMSPNSFDRKEEERVKYIQLDRQLVSPYMHFAGGLALAHKHTENNYPKRPDSLYYKYRSNVIDGWLGYNIAGKRLLNSNVRDRRFVAARFANNSFEEVPYQVGDNLNLAFNNISLALASFTFFRQDFFKTNYIYGFGVTEDVPYGYKFSLTGGWTRQHHFERMYSGVRGDIYLVTKGKDFYRFFLRGGSFFRNYEFEDAGIMAGASVFSRLLSVKNYKLRQYFSAGYTRLFDPVTTEFLRIDNSLGLNNYRYPYLNGSQRMSFSSETMLYLNNRFLGFRFAPFITTDVSFLNNGYLTFKKDVYAGFGGGIRTRNENLVFGTIELRGIVFPYRIEGVPFYRILLRSNLRYRYNSTYVSKPEIINWNIDDGR